MSNEIKRPSDSIRLARLAVVETKVQYIEGAVKANSQKLGEIDNKVDNISTHMAKQNGTLPRLEQHMNTLLGRVSENEKETQKVGTKAKMTWAALSAILTGVLLTLIKFAIGL
jgi:hypothetical protein